MITYTTKGDTISLGFATLYGHFALRKEKLDSVYSTSNACRYASRVRQILAELARGKRAVRAFERPFARHYKP